MYSINREKLAPAPLPSFLLLMAIKLFTKGFKGVQAGYVISDGGESGKEGIIWRKG
jgi:hypothetical protein